MHLFERFNRDLFPFFQNLENEDCLLHLLNSLLDMESPLVSCFFYTMTQEPVLNKEDYSMISVIGKNQDNDRVEITLIFSKDNAMEGYLSQQFGRMVSASSLDHFRGAEKTYCQMIHFQETVEEEKETFKKTVGLRSVQEGSDIQLFLKQNMTMYYMNQLPTPKTEEELWLVFLNDPLSPLLQEHPNLPDCLKRAIDFVHSEEKPEGTSNVVYLFTISPEELEKQKQETRETFLEGNYPEAYWDEYLSGILKSFRVGKEEMCRKVVINASKAGLSLDEIAEMLNIPLYQVRSFLRENELGFSGFDNL